jgi:hypothetical protein
MDNITIFVAVTAAAVVIQAGILVSMYLAVRKTDARIEALTGDVRAKVLPMVETAHSMLNELRPKIETAVTNVSDSTAMIRTQLERVDATINDVIDRTRLQVIRADELVGRTLDRVEATTDLVHETVISPVRKVSGLMQGITVALEFLFSRKRRSRENVGVQQDEMFI